MPLELRSVRKQFPGHCAVEDLSLTLEQGEFFSLVGPSGCGKTTTLRMVGGFEQPTSGEILLNGLLLNGRKPHQRNVSTVFQNYALFPHLTVAQNVAFGLQRHGVRDTRKQVAEVLRIVELTGKEARLPAQLSGGEKQRVALARSLVLKPDVLLLDEPLAALDPQLRKQMRMELKALQREAGIAFLFVTHDQEEALSLSNRIAIMHKGHVEQIATPEDAYLRPASRFAAEFLGEVNWMGAIGIRPEATRLSHVFREGALPCRVVTTMFCGAVTRVDVECAEGRASAKLECGRTPFAPGDTAYIYWDRSDEMHLPE